MRIETHAAVPTRFQDIKPTVESNEVKTNKWSYIESLFSHWFAAQVSSTIAGGSRVLCAYCFRQSDLVALSDLLWRLASHR